jgi:hypothetical protein
MKCNDAERFVVAQKGAHKMKMMIAVALLACVPVAVAESNFNYPKANLAKFVVEKLDVTSVPAELRPKLAHEKKTLGDYGYTTVKVDGTEASLKAPQGNSQIAITVLEQSKSGIYVCLNSQAQGPNASQIQRVLLLKSKTADGLLRGREASKEFDTCPVIGAPDSPDVF